MARSRIVYIGILALSLVAAGPLAEEKKQPEPRPTGIVERSEPVTPFIFDGDLRDLPAPPEWKPGDPVREIPRRFYPSPEDEEQYTPSGITHVDELYEAQRDFAPRAGGSFTTPSRSFPGRNYTGVNPPDTVGDVGPNHYIQMVNASGGTVVTIWDKAEPTPNQLTTFALDSLGSGQCASGFGDPIVLYDRLAERWMLSEFSSSGNNLCLYISQTPDPVSGGWFNYGYTAPSFPDYPKYGVWPTDANGGEGSYIVTANDGGPGIYALDRGAMLSGSPGTYQRLTIPGLPGFSFESPSPADLDGPTPPPTGASAIIMRHRDTENHSGPAAPGDLLEMFVFDVDWNTPSNTTITQGPSVDTSEFDSDVCGLTSFFCFPQPGTGTTLDPLREVIMNRLQYINHGTHETLVANYTVDVDATDHGGLRWFEVRRTGGGAWALNQEGTYSIDADNRFMGSAAMDQSGNIAAAYSVTSGSTFPSLRYTGRKVDDPLNVMTQAESNIHAGTGSNSSNRYGDYASMNLDPEDDCTFWFTSLDNTSSNWRTQIASFRFEACGCEFEPPALLVAGSVAGDNAIDVDWDDSSDSAIQAYRVRRALAPGGPYETVADIVDSSPGSGGLGSYTFTDTDVSGGTTYYYIVLANDGAACTSPTSNEVDVTATGACTLSPSFAGLQDVTSPFESTCSLDLSWSSATANCDGPLRYNVYRSDTAEFTPDLSNRIATALSGMTYSDFAELESGERYYYIVRAVDLDSGVEEQNATEVSSVPFGTLTTGTWTDDGGDNGFAKMIMEDPWDLDATEGNLEPNVYKTGTYSNLQCAALTTPTLQLGAASVLTFSTKYEIENSWDKGEVQISTDGGATWTRLEVGYPGTSTQASDNCGFPTGQYFTGTNLTWSDFMVDLSAWSGQLVKVRWQLSTDSSQTRTGWWIDDVSITQVDVPGDCATGSSCEDNPFVAVVPDGPAAVCDGEAVELAAQLTNGTGPFLYQWSRDGVDIPSATGPTYSALDTGMHAYNVRVRSTLCAEEATDGSPTVLEWRGKPQFDGIQNTSSGLESTCAVQLDWDAASTVCDGPVTYSVYRDTTTPVSVTSGNLIRSGLMETSFTDRSALEDGTLYFYVVRAVETSNGQDDGNVIELAAEALTPEDGFYLPVFDNFEDPETFDDWTVVTAPGHNCGTWAPSSSATPRPADGSGSYALTDNRSCGAADVTWNSLYSPIIDADVDGLAAVTLGFDINYNHNVGDTAALEVFDGSSWQQIWFENANDVNEHQEYDLLPYSVGNATLQVRFVYTKAIEDEWLALDDIFLLAEVDTQCTTNSVPPSVPDGSAFSNPLRGDRMSVAGDELRTTWDVDSCRATDYNLLYGNLADVASYSLAGSICGIGDTGSFDWASVPAGDLFFLVVGTDGADMESSWGIDSVGNERNGGAASGECAAVAKDTSNVCP
ncbi:MAG: hypothetical protein GY716_00775 [bacterium]|nr:hypothetical protein [bacterium]